MKIFMHNVSNGSQRALNDAKKIKKNNRVSNCYAEFFYKNLQNCLCISRLVCVPVFVFMLL